MLYKHILRRVATKRLGESEYVKVPLERRQINDDRLAPFENNTNDTLLSVTGTKIYTDRTETKLAKQLAPLKLKIHRKFSIAFKHIHLDQEIRLPGLSLWL